MRQISRIWINIIILVSMLAGHGVTYATDDLVRFSFPEGVSLDLPKNWVVFSDSQRNSSEATAALAFAANYYDDNNNALGVVNIKYYPQIWLTQADVRSFSAQDVIDFDALLKEIMIPSMRAANISLTSWIGTQKTNVNGITALVTEYKRKSFKGSGEFRVRLIRVLAADKSFTLTISYHEGDYLLRPITDKIINSLSHKSIKNT